MASRHQNLLLSIDVSRPNRHILDGNQLSLFSVHWPSSADWTNFSSAAENVKDLGNLPWHREVQSLFLFTLVLFHFASCCFVVWSLHLCRLSFHSIPLPPPTPPSPSHLHPLTLVSVPSTVIPTTSTHKETNKHESPDWLYVSLWKQISERGDLFRGLPWQLWTSHPSLWFSRLNI